MTRPRCPRCHARMWPDLELDGRRQDEIWSCIPCGHIERPGFEPMAMPVNKLGHATPNAEPRMHVARG